VIDNKATVSATVNHRGFATGNAVKSDIFCQLERVMSDDFLGQTKKAEDCSSAFSGLYPPPGTLPN
jgi:hypothetical protein